MNTMETLPRVVGRRYQLQRALGAGTMGTVYETIDRLSGQRLALKQVQIPTEQLAYGTRTGVEDDLILSLAQEFRILASLRHPNIISVLDYGFETAAGEQRPYFTMELLEDGQTLLDAANPRDHDSRIDLIVQVLQALVYLHRRRILHRDLKPKNVLVIGDVVKVLDFGLSVQTEQAKAGEVAGTPSYMAPELWTGGQASRESDIYAVGVMAYRLLAGKAPFDVSNLKQLFADITTRPPDLAPLRTSDAVRAVVGRMMAREPSERYGDAAEVIAALHAAIGRPAPVETPAVRESFLQAATFVGRESETAHIMRALDEAAGGRGAALLIAGESGVGKSRLLDEVRTQALVRGSLALMGQAVEGYDVPYDLWRGAMRWLALLSSLSPQQAAILKPFVPDIARLIGREVPDAPELTPDAARSRLLSLVESLFAEQADQLQQPILVIAEDLQWADQESLLLLNRLAEASRRLPLVLIGSFRDDDAPDLPLALPAMSLMRLARLNPHQTASLTEAMLGPAGENDELIALLQRETEGNAFFLVEMVRALAEEVGQLSAIGEAPLPYSLITGGVQGVIERRLSRVPEAARPFVWLSAVSGRQLDLRVLRHALEAEGLAGALDGWLRDCADAAVLEVVDGAWRFTHHKLRDGALAQVEDHDFRYLSRQLAVALEAVSEVAARQDYELLAYYWRGAERADKEAHYDTLVGENALRAGAYQLAIPYLERALALQDGASISPRKTAAVQQALGDALFSAGRTSEAYRCYHHSLSICRDIGYRWGEASAINRLGDVAQAVGQTDDAGVLYRDGLRIAIDARAQVVALASLVRLAGLMARSGQPMAAAELAALALNHVVSDGQTHYLAGQLLRDLSGELPSDVLAAATRRGASMDLKEAAATLLA